MWWRKRFDSKGYDELLKRIITLEIDQGKIFNLMNSLRGLVNRKFHIGEEEEESEEPAKSKSTDLKGGVLLPEP